MKCNIIAAAGTALLLSAVAAQAAAITVAPSPLIANGSVEAIYVANSAGDVDELSLTAPVSIPNIFCNNVGGVCSSASAIGSTVPLGSFVNASLVFSLSNLTPADANVFYSNAPDSDGNYHVVVTTDFASLGIGSVNPVQSVIDGLAAGTTVTYVAWEDKTAENGGDFDYNDLVFAFTNVAPVQVPEPISISLFGAGLAGAAWFNKRRKAKQA
jgi:hypothetical protein